MTKRRYRTMESVWKKIVSLKKNYTIIPKEQIYSKKMNLIYRDICYYNLYEKYLCGGISYEDWQKIIEYMTL